MPSWIATVVGCWIYCNGVARAKARGKSVATTEIPEVVTISEDPPSEIVSVKLEPSPPGPLEAVDESVVMMEDRELEIEIAV